MDYLRWFAIHTFLQSSCPRWLKVMLSVITAVVMLEIFLILAVVFLLTVLFSTVYYKKKKASRLPTYVRNSSPNDFSYETKPFALEKLDEDMFRTVLKKMDYRAGTRLYRSSRSMKEFCDQKRIRFFYPGKVLVYQEQRFLRDPLVKKVFPLRSNYAESLVPSGISVWRDAFDSVNSDLLRCSSVWLKGRISSECFKEVLEDLKGIRNVIELIVEPALLSDDFQSAVKISKPKLVACDLSYYLKHSDFFKEMYYKNGMDVRFCFFGYSARTENFRNIFKHCGYRETLEVWLLEGIQLWFLHFIVTEWFRGANVGNLSKIHIAFPDSWYLTVIRLKIMHMELEDHVSLLIGEDVFEGKRRRTSNGKDTVRMYWSDCEYEKPYVDIHFFE